MGECFGTGTWEETVDVGFGEHMGYPIAQHPCDDCMYHGPKPGCEVRFLPKRVKFVRPREEVMSYEDFELSLLKGHYVTTSFEPFREAYNRYLKEINKKDSGPSFASCILIFDRGVCNETETIVY